MLVRPLLDSSIAAARMYRMILRDRLVVLALIITVIVGMGSSVMMIMASTMMAPWFRGEVIAAAPDIR